MNNANRRASGGEAESAAAAYLAGKGYEIVSRNYRGDRCEIDIIARGGNTIVFAEVKSSDSVFEPEYSVDEQKITHLARAAEAFISDNGLQGMEFRFDVLAMRKDGELWRITHITDAFRP